jgi:bifunctional non-homologous end joining protein LigD
VRKTKADIDALLKSLPRVKVEFIAPMLAKLSNSIPRGPNWLYELKFDGYRMLAVKQGRRVTLFSRRGNVLNSQYPEIARAFDFLPNKTIVDGEVVAVDEKGRPSFAALQRFRSGTASRYFYAFDLLALDGKDVRSLSLIERRTLLQQKLFDRDREPIRLSEVFEASAGRLVKAVRRQGLEGIVAKRAESRYEPGQRSGAWVKFKTNKGQELVIGGYKPGSSSFEYLLAGYYEGPKLIFVAKIKNGFVPALKLELSKRFPRLETDVCPFANLPEPKSARRGEALTADVMKNMQWLKPKLVAQIEFTDWTENNHLRHSKFVGLRADKDPRSVIREVG